CSCSYSLHESSSAPFVLLPVPTRRSSDLDLPRGDDRAVDVPPLRRRGEGAGAGEHHRVRADAAVHGRRIARRGRVDGALPAVGRSEEHTSELQSRENLVCRLLLEKKKSKK